MTVSKFVDLVARLFSPEVFNGACLMAANGQMKWGESSEDFAPSVDFDGG